MLKLVKVFKSKWWDLFPVVPFFIIAAAEGNTYWVAGVSLILWLFSLTIRHFVKD